MQTIDGRYKLTRFRYDALAGYEPTAIERFDSKGEALRRYRSALLEDGVHPDLFDERSQDYIA